jgi:hypothetical protein
MNFFGCSTGYIDVERIKTDKRTFASKFAGSPDSRRLNPPKGEKLYINWSIPLEFSSDRYRMKVDIVYRNLSREAYVFPIKRRAGGKIIELLGDEFKQKEGFLSYKMEIINLDGEVLSDYTHRMWVDLILPCGSK